jgi:hypothetical protein
VTADQWLLALTEHLSHLGLLKTPRTPTLYSGLLSKCACHPQDLPLPPPLILGPSPWHLLWPVSVVGHDTTRHVTRCVTGFALGLLGEGRASHGSCSLATRAPERGLLGAELSFPENPALQGLQPAAESPSWAGGGDDLWGLHIQSTGGMLI